MDNNEFRRFESNTKKVTVNYTKRQLIISDINNTNTYNFADVKWCTISCKENHKIISYKTFVKNIIFIAAVIVIVKIIGSYAGYALSESSYPFYYSSYQIFIDFIVGFIIGLVWSFLSHKNKNNICNKLQVEIIVKEKQYRETIDFINKPVAINGEEYKKNSIIAESLVDEIKYNVLTQNR